MFCRSPFGSEWWLRFVTLFMVGLLLAACGAVATRTPPQSAPAPVVIKTKPEAKPTPAAPPVEQPPPAITQEDLPTPPVAPPSVQDLALWQSRLEKYLLGGDAGTDPESLLILKRQLAATTLDPDSERVLLATIGLLDQNRLSALLQQQQPSGSILLPALQMVLGDRLLATGDSVRARSLWQQAADTRQAAQTASEAQRRLQPALAATGDGPFRVGLLLPLSGRHTAIGEHLLHAAQQALADFPDVTIELLVEDSAGVVDRALAGVERLAAQNVKLIIGPVFLAPAKAAAEAAHRRGIPIMPLNPHQDILRAGNLAQRPQQGGQQPSGDSYPDILLNAFLPEQQAEAMANYAIGVRGLRRFAVLSPASPYGEMTGRAFVREALRVGGQLARVADFPEDGSDFTQAMQNLAQATPGFDALFIPARADQVRLIAPQAANVNISVAKVAFLGTALWNNPDLLLADGTDYLNGSLFCDTDPFLRKQFESRYQQLWGSRPPALSQLVYDSVAILVQALRDQRLGGANWRQVLMRPEGFYSSSGRVRFLRNGLSQREYHFFQVTPEGIKTLTPPSPPIPGLPPLDAQPVAPVAGDAALPPTNQPVAPIQGQPMAPADRDAIDAPAASETLPFDEPTAGPEIMPPPVEPTPAPGSSSHSGRPLGTPGEVAPSRGGSGTGAARVAPPPGLATPGTRTASPPGLSPATAPYSGPGVRPPPGLSADTPYPGPGMQPPPGLPTSGSRSQLPPGVSPNYGPGIQPPPGLSGAGSRSRIQPAPGASTPGSRGTVPAIPRPGSLPPPIDETGTPPTRPAAPFAPPDFEPGYAPAPARAPNSGAGTGTVPEAFDAEAGPAPTTAAPTIGARSAGAPTGSAYPKTGTQSAPGRPYPRPGNVPPSTGVPYPGPEGGSGQGRPYRGPGAADTVPDISY
ncbi:MAG: penicillin-binding protein activator [Magnetococcales bacterium]|nr:penicillin-binding protein activator [Magnetococcales bacterium]